MVKDPKFLEHAEKLVPHAPHSAGDDLARGFPKGVSGAPELVKLIKKIFTEKYGIAFD